jgi:hypothetical protein
MGRTVRVLFATIRAVYGGVNALPHETMPKTE